MRFRFMLPSASVKSAGFSFGLFLFFAFFFSFHIYLRRLHKASINWKDETATLMFDQFIEEAPRVKSSSIVTTEHEQRRIKTTDCTPFNIASRFEPTTRYKESARLPQWMKDYFDWHREETLKINACNFWDHRFLILRCSNAERKCGGVADRLKPLPFMVAAAAKSKRVLLIRWQRPTKLEEFLVPNEINWSVPDWMYELTNDFDKSEDVLRIPATRKIYSGIDKYHKRPVLEGFIQDYFGGSSYYYRLDCLMDENKELDKEHLKKFDDMAGWADYELVFRDLWYTVFEPSPPVAKLVRDKLTSANLVPGKFSTSQFRAFYAIEHKKELRTNHDLAVKTRNALNCASFLQAGDPIYFASDSQYAVRFARELGEDMGYPIITFDDENEALHLDKRDQWKSGNVADFYPTFVDLLVMAEAKCVAHGVGGYGRFANLLSTDPSCVVRHDDERVRKRTECQWRESKDEIIDVW